MRYLMVMVLASFSGCHAVFGLEPDTEDAGAVPVCPSMYTPAASGTYWVGTDAKGWLDAQQTCARHASPETGHTHLAVLEGAAALSEVADLVKAPTLWIGSSDLTIEGEFRWVTAQELAFPQLGSPVWALGQPDDAEGAEDCVAVDLESSRLLYDRECFNPSAFLCECDSHPSVEANYGL
ncbi:MAG: C-type lectin domain-containing protein [Kofleriaceae bacterium]|nr:C-type lectin domain-containing protein [Kofleriaceae bacterium]